MTAVNVPNRLLTGLVSSALALSMAGIVGCSSQGGSAAAGSSASSPAAAEDSAAAADTSSFLEEGVWLISHRDFASSVVDDYTYSEDGFFTSHSGQYTDFEGNKSSTSYEFSNPAEDGSYDMSIISDDGTESTIHVERSFTVDEEALTAQLVENFIPDEGDPYSDTFDYTFYTDGTIKTMIETFTHVYPIFDEDGNQIGDPVKTTIRYSYEFDEHGNLVSRASEQIEGSEDDAYSFTTIEYVYDDEGNAVSATQTSAYGDNEPFTTELTFDVDENGNIVAVYMDGELSVSYTWTYIEHPLALEALETMPLRFVQL